MPGTVDAVSGRIAGLGVLHPAVERLAFVGPLLLAVLPGYYRISGGRRAGGIRRQRRPIFGAFAGAGRFPGAVLVEGVKRHAFRVGKRWSLCRLGDAWR